MATTERLRLGELVVFLALVAGLSGSLTARAGAAPATARPFDDIIASGFLKVAVYRDFAPYAFYRDGRLVGIDVDIAHAIAAQLGVEAQVMEFTADETVSDDLRNAVWKGPVVGGDTADLMLHVPYDRNLALQNEFIAIFAPYHQEEIVLARDLSTLGAESSLTVFRFEKVGVELDTLSDFYLSGLYRGQLRHNVVHFRTLDAAVMALRGKEVAAIMGPRSQVEAGLADNPGAYAIEAVDMSGIGQSSWTIGTAVKTENRQLGYSVANIMSALQRDGRLAEIFAKYGATYRPPAY